MTKAMVAMAGLVAALGLSGCIMVGHSSGGGWFFWPGGGIGLVLLVVALLVFARRR